MPAGGNTYTQQIKSVKQAANVSAENITEEIYKQNLELLDQRRRVEQLIDSVSEGVFAVDEKL